jgi:hypothetical protein
VKTFHKFGIKVLGDAVLNHRCAQHKNQNGVWNIFGGRLNWDDRAVVADDPHFQVCTSFLYVLCSLFCLFYVLSNVFDTKSNSF